MLFKLAFRNVKRQIGSYLIYFITITLTIALVFSVNNLIQSDMMDVLLEDYYDGTKSILIALTAILSLIMAFVLGYATNFLLRRRKKEFGVYLTLGMSRLNIITIFLCETAITFVVALFVGVALGLVIYQGLMLVFISVVELEYTVGGYSAAALAYTAIIVGVVFLLSSVASLSYLRVAKISKLLNGDRIVEKKVQLPALWLAVAVIFLAVSIGCFYMFLGWLDMPDFFDRTDLAFGIVMLFITSVILSAVGLCRGVTWLIVKLKSGRAKGVGMFTARQLSGRTSANSVMIGLLTLLMTFVIIGPNIFLSISDIIEIENDRQYLYDIEGYYFAKEDDSQSAEEEIEESIVDTIESYAEIDKSCFVRMYRESGTGIRNREYVAESQFRELCSMFGYDLPQLNGEILECSEVTEGEFILNVSDSGKYSLSCPSGMISTNYNINQWNVLPDEELVEGDFFQYNLFINLKEGKFDARGLDKTLFNLNERYDYYISFDIKECERLYNIGAVGLFLLGDLYISAVFLLMTMAILSLKMLTMITEDREKYRTLWKLGATEGMLKKSLVLQLMFFCMVPLILPIIFNFPIASIMSYMLAKSKIFGQTAMVALQLFGYSAVVVAICAIYLIAAAVVSWTDIKKSLRE